jgi:predicted DNA-binding protein (MmcQ/YjbR family)
VFCVPKMFAVYGGNCKRTGEMVPFPYSLLIKVDESDGAALGQDRRFFYPMYLGPLGWLGLDFAAADVDWDEVRELVDASYRLTASKRLIKQLDRDREAR